MEENYKSGNQLKAVQREAIVFRHSNSCFNINDNANKLDIKWNDLIGSTGAGLVL